KLQDRVLLGCKTDRLVANSGSAPIETEQQFADADRRLGKSRRSTNDRSHARDQFAGLERLCQKVVGAKAQPLDLVVHLSEPREDQHRGSYSGGPQLTQDFIAVDVRQHEVENDEVV